MEFKKIDFNDNLNILRNISDLKYGIIKAGATTFNFNEKGLKSVISALGVFKLNKFSIESVQDFTKEFRKVFEDEYIFSKHSRNYLALLLNSLNNYSKEIFEKLLKEEFNLNNFLFDERLDNFICESLIDEISIIRNSEYGRYCIREISNELFKGANEKKLTRLFKRASSNPNLTIDDIVNKELKKNLKKEYDEFDPNIFLFIIRVFNYQFDKISFSEGRSFAFSLDFKAYNFLYQKQYEQITTLVKNVISQSPKLGLKP